MVAWWLPPCDVRRGLGRALTQYWVQPLPKPPKSTGAIESLLSATPENMLKCSLARERLSLLYVIDLLLVAKQDYDHSLSLDSVLITS